MAAKTNEAATLEISSLDDKGVKRNFRVGDEWQLQLRVVPLAGGKVENAGEFRFMVSGCSIKVVPIKPTCVFPPGPNDAAKFMLTANKSGEHRLTISVIRDESIMHVEEYIFTVLE